MARLARVVIPGIPHHVTQRGNRRQQVFFHDKDYQTYLALLAEWSAKTELTIWAYCLMPNHVHIIAVPSTETSLHKTFQETHRRYTSTINLREGWRGYLWQGRFASFPMDEHHALAAVRYVEYNPVRAGLAESPEGWQWSSAGSRTRGENVFPVVPPSPPAPTDIDSLEELLHRHERTGRPLGGIEFIRKLEDVTKRALLPKKRGPKSGRDSTISSYPNA